jgi:Dyp-type peroxidase family
MAGISIDLDNIQGNSFGGFNKDFQTFVFLKFADAKKGRAWIQEIAGEISTSRQVLQFNDQFKALKADGVQHPEQLISATWTNLALSFQGLKALGLKSTDLSKFPEEFRDGMAARSSDIGDVGNSAPSKWNAPFNSADIHAVLLLAADNETDLNARFQGVTNSATFQAGVNIVQPVVQGRTRVDQPGHEHFGFKDGVSQPGIRGINAPDDPLANPNQGHPGQDLLWPGEFVLGYPTQKRKAKKGHDGPNPDPGTTSKSGPSWTKNGSYLVFRRLQQDVAKFQTQIKDLATQLSMTQDLVGAKLVGRYKSGCPIEALKFQAGPKPYVPPSVDPGIANPALADDDTLNNNFEFGDDAAGASCPVGAHIRKAYPRDEETPPSSKADSESETQTHRLLRRGIPFGNSLGAAQGGGANDPRGLLFLAYQKDIGEHFEFVQKQWVNDPNFPGGTQAGQDPIIAQSASGPFKLDASTLPIKHFVTTTGGEYFLSPSIDTLVGIGNNKI